MEEPVEHEFNIIMITNNIQNKITLESRLTESDGTKGDLVKLETLMIYIL